MDILSNNNVAWESKANWFHIFVKNKIEMETLTIKINTRSNKGKHLIELINEMEKEGSVEIQKAETYREVKTAIKELKTGKVKPISELFK